IEPAHRTSATDQLAQLRQAADFEVRSHGVVERRAVSVQPHRSQLSRLCAGHVRYQIVTDVPDDGGIESEPLDCEEEDGGIRLGDRDLARYHDVVDEIAETRRVELFPLEIGGSIGDDSRSDTETLQVR